MIMGRQPDVLALKGELQKNEKTEEAIQIFLDFSDKAQKKLFRGVGSFKRRQSIILNFKTARKCCPRDGCGIDAIWK